MKNNQTNLNRNAIFNLAVIVVALGYFVDIFDLTLFNMLRIKSLESLGVPKDQLVDLGIKLLNWQMIGMLLGGIFWGVLGDKKGRLTVLFSSIILYSIANIANAFVHTVDQYACLRFISGIGLAGELGAGITLIAETLPKSHRGLGTAMVAAIGVLGACFGGIIVEIFEWRTCYLIGGGLGIALLLLRFKVFESNLFHESQKKYSNQKEWGNFLNLFSSFEKIKKFYHCIVIGIPIWYVAGLLMTFAPELSKDLGVQFAILSSRAIAITYLGLALGDFLCGVVGQKLKSRIKSIFIFISACFFFIGLLFFTAAHHSERFYYALCFFIGVGAGYWATFVTIAAEQFGTNIRATAATSIPNFVRASVVPMTLLFKLIKPNFGITQSMFLIGIIVFILALISAWSLKETFHLDLDYIE